MIWFVDTQHGVPTVSVGHLRDYFDKRLADRGLPLVIAKDLGIGLTMLDGVVQAVRVGFLAEQSARVGASLGASLAKGCIELADADAEALRAGEPRTLMIADSGIAPAGTITLYLGATEEELVERFLNEGVVTERAQIRGLLSDEERENLRGRLLDAATLPEHQVTEVARIGVRGRPWWKFW